MAPRQALGNVSVLDSEWTSTPLNRRFLPPLHFPRPSSRHNNRGEFHSNNPTTGGQKLDDNSGNDSGNNGSGSKQPADSPNGNSNGGDSSSTSKDSSSSKPSSTSKASTPTPTNCPFCIADNDPRILYNGSWFLSGFGDETTHSTVTPGSFLTFPFNGSGIVVLGTVPQSNSSSLPPTVSFILDAQDPFVVTQPLASHAFFNQPLFSTAQLNNTPHQLVINVTSAGSPFTVDYFVVFPPDVHDVISSTSQVSPTDASANTSLNGGAFDASALLTIKLLAVFLGIMVLILLLIIGFFIFRMRKTPSRRRKPSLPGNPLTSESKRGRASAGRVETLFTSTDSILRNNNSIMWSEWSRSEGVGSEYVPSPAPPVPASGKKSPLFPFI